MPDSQCMGSDSMITPSPSLSIHTASSPLRSGTNIWIYVGIALFVAMIIVATISVIFVIKKCRKRRNQEQTAEIFPVPYNARYFVVFNSYLLLLCCSIQFSRQ